MVTIMCINAYLFVYVCVSVCARVYNMLFCVCLCLCVCVNVNVRACMCVYEWTLYRVCLS